MEARIHDPKVHQSSISVSLLIASALQEQNKHLKACSQVHKFQTLENERISSSSSWKADFSQVADLSGSQ